MGTRIRRATPGSRRRRLEPRKSPLQERSRATVEFILAAAAQVFDDTGYGSATTNRIAERAGVSIGTLYQYFPGKEALAGMLLERHVEQGAVLIGRLVRHARTRRMSLRRTLRLFVGAMLEFHADRPRLQHILLHEVPRPPRVEAQLLRAEAAAVRAVAALLRHHTEMVGRNLERVASIAVPAVEDLTHRFVTHPPPGLSRGAFVAELVTMLEAYLVRGGRSAV